MNYQILLGDNRTTLKTIADNSIDAIVTDPPYGIDFLGKSWDANTGALETYQECLRVLKPGGYILAFSAARTYHHLAVTLEQAGFEIRDQIMWIYSSGFPKSQDVGRQLHKKEHSKPDKQRYTKNEMTKEGDNYRHNTNKKLYKILPDINGDRLEKSHEGEGYGYIFEEIITIHNEWSGWGTCLKPAHEPIALARKPTPLTFARNCQTHGVGALNIDATRIPYDDPAEAEADAKWRAKWSRHNIGGPTFAEDDIYKQREKKPAAGKRTASFHQATGGGQTQSGGDGSGGWEASQIGRFPSNVLGEIAEPYQKYFYCPKVSRRERHIGFEDPGPQTARARDEDGNTLPYAEKVAGASPTMLAERLVDSPGNNHPTVKPIELMKYLIRLITPAGGTVLDPFNGSGSTGCAAVELGHPYIGCELDPAYVEIAQRRIEAWYADANPTLFNRLFDTE